MRTRFTYASFYKWTAVFAVVCAGVLPLAASADTLFFDGFESGDFSSWTSFDPQWSVASVTNAHEGSKEAHVVGSTTAENVLAKSVSTGEYENISLAYWYKITNTGALDAGDHLFIEWSVNGGTTWDATPLVDYNATDTDNVWVFTSHALPVGASNQNGFAFRIRSALSAGSDEMRFDDFHLLGTPIAGEPADVCPNIDGVQETVPTGHHLDAGQCIPDPIDICPNIDGIQETVPTGFHLESGQCLLDSPPSGLVSLFSDGFESGNFGLWDSADSAWLVNTVAPHEGVNQARVVGSSTAEQILRKTVSTSGYEDIVLSYWYKITGGNVLEAADHLFVEWSKDGGTTWETPLVDYTNASTGSQWVNATHALPGSAEDTSGFVFRFRSALLTPSTDELRLDDVLLSGKLIEEEPPIDVCPNIDGVQTSVPVGYHTEGNDCISDPVDVCPNLDGDQVEIPDNYHLEESQCVPNPVDVCANIDGLQTEVPEGHHAEGDQCILDPIDVCLNLDGFQEIVPAGYHLDNGQCVLDSVDICLNLDGVQVAVPAGYHQDGDNCLPDPVDVCPNLDGVQETVPLGYHLDGGQCVLTPIPPTASSTGSITVCKIIVDAKGNATTSTPGTTFFIPGVTPEKETSQGSPAGEIPDTTFTTPLSFNKAIFGNTPDAACVTYADLALGGYYYGEEVITGNASKWKKPKYNDETRWKVEDKYDLFLWSGELFDKKRWNDTDRKLDSDGYIKLTKSRPDRTLVVMNTEKPQHRFIDWGKAWSSWWSD